MARHKNIGSSFDDFLEEEGILNEVDKVALKRVIAFQIRKEMETRKITQAEMARRMNTSRTVVSRLLCPDNCSVTLNTLSNVATVLGKRLRVEFS